MIPITNQSHVLSYIYKRLKHTKSDQLSYYWKLQDVQQISLCIVRVPSVATNATDSLCELTAVPVALLVGKHKGRIGSKLQGKCTSVQAQIKVLVHTGTHQCMIQFTGDEIKGTAAKHQ